MTGTAGKLVLASAGSESSFSVKSLSRETESLALLPALQIGVVMVIQKTNPNLYGNFSATSAHIQKHCLHMHFYPNQPPELPCPG